MMNPLSRKMFRSPMASRMPQGILASSAPMMTSAQKAMAKKQPMKAQTGASVNTQNYMSAIAQLTQQGDVQTLTNILQDSRLPTRVRTAARDAIGSLQPKPRNIGPQVPPQVGPPMASIPSIQGPPAVTVPGYSVGTDGAVLAGLTDDQLAARMSAEANALNAGQSKTTTMPPSVSQGIQNVQAVLAKPTSPAITPGSDPLVEQAREQAQSATSGISNMLGGAFAYPGDINKALDYAYPEPPPGASRLDRALNFLQRGAFATVRAPYDVGAQIAGFGQETEKFLTDPYYTPEEQAAAQQSMIAAGQSPQGRPFPPSLTPGLDTLGVFKGDEQAKDIEPDITDMSVGADTEDAAIKPAPTTATDPDAPTTTTTTNAADIKAPVIKMLTDVIEGRETDADLNAEQASTPEAAAALNESFMKDMVMPEEVSLSDMEKKAKDIMGFDPSKADEQKRSSFWTNLTMAGLAMAAGESDNALTNVAKGLMVGLDAYSKDIKDLNAQDREDRKEYRATLRTLIKNEEDKNIAFAEMQNNYNAKSAELDQRAALEGENQALQRERMNLDKSLAQQRMEAQLVTTLAQLDMDAERLALQGKQFDETARHNAVRESILMLSEQPEWVKSGIALGYVDKDGEWTDEGMAWVNDNAQTIMLSSFLDNKNKSTDDDRDAQAISNILSGTYNADDIARASNSAVGKIILATSGEKDFVARLKELMPPAPKV